MAKNKAQIQLEAMEVITPLKRCGVGITMGGGKTLLGLKHMHNNFHEFARFLVVGPKKTTFKTWREETVKYNMEHLISHIVFSTYLSLVKQDFEYDVVYLDECHNLRPNHESWLDVYTGKILGLTGTPPKYARSEKGRLVSKFCPIIYRYLVDTAIQDGILNDYRIIVHMLKLDTKRNVLITKSNSTWYTSEQASYDYWCSRIDAAITPKDTQICRIMRMKALMSFPGKEALAKKLLDSTMVKTILFTNTHEQADKLCTHSYHSNNKNSEVNLEKFKSGELTKLSCVLQLSEGVNIPELKVGIIIHAYGNERKASQRINIPVLFKLL